MHIKHQVVVYDALILWKLLDFEVKIISNDSETEHRILQLLLVCIVFSNKTRYFNLLCNFPKPSIQ